MKGRIQRIVGATGAVLAGVALLASGVQAAERPDDRSGMLGVGAVAPVADEVPGVFERAVARRVANTVPDPFARSTSPVRPDDRPGVRGPGAAASLAGGVAVESGDGFAWGDAALGAGLTSALLLALGAVAAVTTRHRGRALAR